MSKTCENSVQALFNLAKESDIQHKESSEKVTDLVNQLKTTTYPKEHKKYKDLKAKAGAKLRMSHESKAARDSRCTSAYGIKKICEQSLGKKLQYDATGCVDFLKEKLDIIETKKKLDELKISSPPRKRQNIKVATSPKRINKMVQNSKYSPKIKRSPSHKHTRRDYKSCLSIGKILPPSTQDLISAAHDCEYKFSLKDSSSRRIFNYRYESSTLLTLKNKKKLATLEQRFCEGKKTIGEWLKVVRDCGFVVKINKY